MEISLRAAIGPLPDDVVPFVPDIRLDPGAVRVIMINEIAPENPVENFYSDGSPYDLSVLSLFGEAGFAFASTADLLRAGIYLTNAVKTPKDGYEVPRALIDAHRPILERELGLFENLCAVMLMGDVAKKAFNPIAKARTGKVAVPSGSTYKIRKEQHTCGDLRVFPSYICTGGNIQIEKSKRQMIAGDIGAMMALIGGQTEG